jgi:hypothetical protein
MQTKEDLRHLHAYWNVIQVTFEQELDQGLDGAEEARIREIYNKLKHYYDTTLIISKKVDEFLA